MAHFFFRRRVVAFFEGVALSIRKSSSFLPSLIAAVSHLGVAPRPAHVSPPAPRYFGATFFPFNLLPRATRATLPPTEAIEPPSAANCSSSVVRRSERAFSTCLRKVLSHGAGEGNRTLVCSLGSYMVSNDVNGIATKPAKNHLIDINGLQPIYKTLHRP